MSDHILPNAHQSPNGYVDLVMELLSGEEFKCLMFAVRHILGWQERFSEKRRALSVTMFEQGFTAPKTGAHFGGTGLSRGAIVRAVGGLVAFGLFVEGELKPEGQEYTLGEAPDWDGLRERAAQRLAKNRERTAKARAGRPAKAAAPVSPTDQQAVSPTNQQAVSPTDQQAVSPTDQERSVGQTASGQSDLLKQNHLQNHFQNQVVGVEATTPTTAVPAPVEATAREPVPAPDSAVPAPSAAALAAWGAAFHQLEMQLDHASFDTGLRGAELLGVEVVAGLADVFVVAARSIFARDALQHRLCRTVQRVLSDVYGQAVELRFEVREPAAPPTDEAMPLFRILAEQDANNPMTIRREAAGEETVRSLYERFIAPITPANEASALHLEANYDAGSFGYALSVMAAAQARGRVKDPLAYTLGILRRQEIRS